VLASAGKRPSGAHQVSLTPLTLARKQDRVTCPVQALNSSIFVPRDLCMHTSSSACEAFWIVSVRAPAPPIPILELLLKFKKNRPPLDTYWTTTSDARRASANSLYKSLSSLEQRRAAFRLDDCMVVPVWEAVFAYTSQLCKPVEFLDLNHYGFNRAAAEQASVCQVLNAHISQQFKGRYMLFQVTGYFKKVYLSGWFRTAGSSKTEFCVGPGNVVRLGVCLGRGKDCMDRAHCKQQQNLVPP